ncbi:MAG: hypothetical protein JWM04_1281 [Verrucomicrobiales bacterium]|nr:hypothetical protein [Verrucomicrobiales bacterium]
MYDWHYKDVIVQKPREIAYRLLTQAGGSGLFAEEILQRELGSIQLAAADRGLLQEIYYGVIRWAGTLDFLISRKTGGKTQKPGLRVLLQMALYQLFWLSRIPDHAAVHETVELAKLKGFGPQAGFVNAVLRGYLRDREETSMLLERLKRDDLAVGYSHPDWLVKKWVARYGKEETTRLLTWNNTPPKVFARINTLKISPDELKEVWKKEGVEFTAVEWPWTTFPMVEFQGVSAVEQLESFKKGFFYIQDPSTLLSVEYLEPKEGDSILDLCAAPGGKCTLIAQRMGDKGAVTAEDLAPSRIQLIEENVRRLGLNCVTARLSDGVPSGEQYDRVLVDAPCSNAGVFRRRVELRWRISPSEVERLRAVQLKLLKSAIAKVKPGGCLVYSTCSLEPEENEGVVTEALIEHPEMIVEKQRQLLPFADLVDGAFVAQMRKAK